MRDCDVINNLLILKERAENSTNGQIVLESEKASYVFGEAIAAIRRGADAEKNANERIIKIVDLLTRG